MGSLAAASAHELSTPLNTILLVIGDLKKTIGNDLKSDILLLKLILKLENKIKD